jgi:hypothetical protein
LEKGIDFEHATRVLSAIAWRHAREARRRVVRRSGKAKKSQGARVRKPTKAKAGGARKPRKANESQGFRRSARFPPHRHFREFAGLKSPGMPVLFEIGLFR